MVCIPGLASGVGLGWRRELAAPLLSAPQTVGFIEVIAEACFEKAPLSREVSALAEIWKGAVLPHGLKLSLGSADGIDLDHARRLGALTRQLKAPVVSEHVSFTRGRSAHAARNRDIGHLTQLPLTRTAVSVVAKNTARARQKLPDVPFLLETPAWTLRWPDDEMDEGAFFGEIVRATGCDLLIDLGNIYANALNSGTSPLALLRSYPLEHVAMVHLAGGAYRDGFYVDTHAHNVPPEVFALLQELLRVTGPLPILIERDGNFPPFAELADEVRRTRSLLPTTASVPPVVAPKALPPLTPPSDLALRALSDSQGHLAELLTAQTAPTVTTPFDAAAVAHSRSILHHKRIDETRQKTRFAARPAPSRRDRDDESDRLTWAQRLFGR